MIVPNYKVPPAGFEPAILPGTVFQRRRGYQFRHGGCRGTEQVRALTQDLPGADG